MPVICFFGADGSGKSTLAKALAKKLNNEGFKVKISWMRGSHTMASLLARLLSKLSVFTGFNNPYYGITVPRKLKRIWQLIEFASVLPIILLRFILPCALGSWVIADRYVPDFITWVSLVTDDHDYLEAPEAKFLLALSSKAHVKTYITATFKELARRRQTDHNFLSDQLKIYDVIALAIHAQKLDTTDKTIDESVREVLSLLDLR